jgi:chitin disaccharide deacetylase
MKKLLVRADDLGYSEGINFGIAKSIRNGIVRSTGVMSNMPAAAHGLSLLEGLDVCLGLHTNICAGRPITDPPKIPSITTPDGRFKPSAEYRSAENDFVVLDEVLLEIEAQYKSFVALTGTQPQYFEGHAVASANFFKGLEIVAERHNLKYSPFSTSNTIFVGSTKVYVWMESMQKEYDPFKTLQKAVLHEQDDGVDMMICHPGYLDAYILKNSSLTTPRPFEVEMLTAQDTQTWLTEQETELVDYTVL